MLMNEKTYKLSVSRSNSDKETILTGTIESLLNDLRPILVKGNAINPKVKTDVTDIKALLNNAQKAYKILEKDSYAKTFLDIVK
jgi:hypothetical protein